MRHLHTFLLSLAICGCAFAAQTPPKKAHPQKKQQKTEVTADKLVDATTPAPPPTPPPTPEQGPSSPPEVSYQRGQLLIVARNSTMGDVLNAVKQKTGASVEMPASSGERVVGKFGPGAPRDVMAQLLNGSHFDYVLMGSPADPGALKKVVLMARATGPQAQPKPQPQTPQQNLEAVPEVQTDQTVEENNPDTSQESPSQPEEEQPQPDQTQPDQAQPDQPQPGQPPTVKTPEQLLQELRQQQQQQQNGQPGAPPQQRQ